MSEPSTLECMALPDLIDLRSRVEAEMARRGLSAKVGDLGEAMVIEHFCRTTGLPSLVAAPKGAKNIDAVSRDGHRYSIKTIQTGRKTGTIYPTVVDGVEQVLFEYIVVLLLTTDFKVEAIYRLSWSQFVASRSWDSRMNAHYLSRSRRVFEGGERVG